MSDCFFHGKHSFNRFTAVKQQEKSGCTWRATKVAKLTAKMEADTVGGKRITQLTEAGPAIQRTNHLRAAKTELKSASSKSEQSQLDESDTTESTTDAGMISSVSSEVSLDATVPSSPNEKATQTLVRVEELMWGAIKKDKQLLQVLWTKYPALMVYAQAAKF